MNWKPTKRIKVAGIATLITLVGAIANQVVGLYPHSEAAILIPIIVPAISGWLVKEEKAVDVSSQIDVAPTPVEWAVVSETSTPVAVTTLPASPNANVPVEVNSGGNTNADSIPAVYPPAIAH